ncbi:MAG: dTDP-4-dehydrorhamnose 3,5-epimerase family protein [Bacteroidaceae bacterium]|nr:dTDP-4-dehydrorhamnose 3,5-epimerase family protein [Bacteroidaceae bacterium]
MNVIKTKIDGLVIIEPKLFVDERGYFFESFNQRDFAAAIGDITFVQDNESKSSYGVIRGLHFQKPPFAQSKLVRCVKGAVLDVAVDIRKESPTYGQYVECLLCAHDEEGSRIAKEYAGHTFNCQLSTFNCQLGQQLYIPKGFAHGFVVLSQQAVFQYKCDEFYHPEAEGAIVWNDPTINIDWQIPAEDIILSAKDKSHPMLHDITSPF